MLILLQLHCWYCGTTPSPSPASSYSGDLMVSIVDCIFIPDACLVSHAVMYVCMCVRVCVHPRGINN